MTSYKAAHANLRAQRGPASGYPCQTCGAPARHWAFQYTYPPEFTDPQGRPYSTDPEHYAPLCIPCHRRYDVANDARVREAAVRSAKQTGDAHAERLRTDPEFAARRSAENRENLRRLNLAGMPGREKAAEASARTHRRREPCPECGWVSSPGWITYHLRTAHEIDRYAK